MTSAGTQNAHSHRPKSRPAPDGERRLLLISYHFPPSHEVGARRWQQLAKLAAEAGWALDVVTLDPGDLAACDETALAELPASVRVYGVPDRPLPLDRLVRAAVSWRRRLLTRSRTGERLVPHAPSPGRPPSIGVTELRSPFHSARDALRAFHAWRAHVRSRTWARRAAEVAHQLLRAAHYRSVITCGPPHMVHEAGRMLRRRTGVPLIVDMRDPWSLTPRIQEEIASPLLLQWARRHERRVVEAAALIVANTKQSRRAMQVAYPSARERVIAILNGYDDEPVPPSQHGRCFVIGYAGSIYLDRDPRPLFRAVAATISERGVGPDQLCLEFMGVEAGAHAALLATAAEERIGAYVVVHPARPHADALRFLARATMLVSLPLVSRAPDTDTSIPAKIYDYIRFDAWLLALANPGSATALLLQEIGADVVPPHDVDAIAAAIRARYDAYASGARPKRPRLPERLSRRAQAHRLFEEIERRLPAPRHESPR